MLIVLIILIFVAEISSNSSSKEHPPVSNDYGKICLLIFLYVLQGVPLGIGSSIPYLLQARKVSYTDQALFSFIYWPFSLKLLWAPIVDSLYCNKIGRRKTWLVPTQYLMGIFMLVLSRHINSLMGDDGEGGANMALLTAIFFCLNFLAATQDIAVDGWALTMLMDTNIGWVSTCNTVGQTIGFVMGNIVFLSLESADFSNKYLRSTPQEGGVISFSGFLLVWGVIFLLTTTLVFLFKSERDELREHEKHSIKKVYQLLWEIVQLRSVFTLMFILLTIKIGFAAADTVTGLKLIEAGVPKEHLAMLAVPMIPLNIVIPILITRWSSSRKPVNLLLTGMPYRLFLGLIYALIVWWAPYTKTTSAAGEVTFPAYFYGIMLFASALHQIAVYCMYVPMMTFFANISDPAIGGTYMTLLNTISNLGSNWPQTVSLWFVDKLTMTGCQDETGECVPPCKVSCVYLDGYYIESVVCCIIGFLWLLVMSKRARRLQNLRSNDWVICKPCP
ncbi:hypothetical protein HELRODRAFT_77129 [Helobdella robusta]|uniref:Major facilitator superfamily (MFS) profile domain-containing protein n=1 Tax=Helobdella robusta TaxID=6412 RepID=T1G2T4_HELRO|nr:hypothetical protein HELRODRAFT_77129 [Helobdella robusta]ESO06889.1 hypothetical protein HELRODRAFT_77129 [Helobdella robusta]